MTRGLLPATLLPSLPVLDLVGAEATVGGANVGCGAGVAGAALRCTTRRLVLIDVVRRGHRVRLLGAASKALAGRRVSIVSTDTNRRVARPKIGKDGFRVRLQGAKTRQVATFRFRTKVRFRAGNPHLFRTFTLPQYVDIG